MIIRDNQNYYDIKLTSTHQESFCKTDKQSRKIYDLGHAHFIAPPVDEDDDNIYVEIK